MRVRVRVRDRARARARVRVRVRDIPRVVVARRDLSHELLEHDGHLDAVRRAERVQLDRVLSHRERLLDACSGRWSVDSGKGASARCVELPHPWRLVAEGAEALGEETCGDGRSRSSGRPHERRPGGVGHVGGSLSRLVAGHEMRFHHDGAAGELRRTRMILQPF